VRPPLAGDHDVRDFENATIATELLIRVFAERGHEAALQDKGLGKELERRGQLVLQESPHSVSREC
jgi:hypothetical protein